MTTKQRAGLRSMGAMLQPILHIGKEGIGPTLLKQAYDALEARELIKISVLNNCLDDPKELGIMVAERTRSELVQVIGKKIVLYRESKEHKRITLPAEKKNR